MVKKEQSKKENKQESDNTFPQKKSEVENESPERNETIEKEGDEKVDQETETVTIPLKDYAAQLKEIDHLTQKSDEYSDGWQRERAEFANFRKRMNRDLDNQKINHRVDVIKKYLSIKDDFERALNNLPANIADDPWINGIELIEQKLEKLLESEGIQLIPAENALFDPQFHEAITSEDSDTVESGYVIEVVQQGYTIGERVIRPALVRVAK